MLSNNEGFDENLDYYDYGLQMRKRMLQWLSIPVCVAPLAAPSALPADKKMPVCFIDFEFNVKRLLKKRGFMATTGKSKTPAHQNREENLLVVWGIVTYITKRV